MTVPACHRTLAASYITTRLNARDTAKMGLPSPSLCATAVVTACTFSPCHYLPESAIVS